ncbi:MAG: hypothetical protein JW774_08825 [Candidatus Aureabacteria bacterium]|nr:hypothetical protein [Candidatus Auribacterota bacterium]
MKKMLCSLLLMGLPVCADEQQHGPPLAPPSSIVLSSEELLLHFKVFIIADLFQRIVSRQALSHHDFFELTDIELEILLNESIRQEPLVSDSKTLQYYFKEHELFIHLESAFFRCYRLEVLPGQFEYKTESITSSDFKLFSKNIT